MHDLAAPAPAAGGKKILVGIGTGLIAFMAYTCVYAYRKPFTVAVYDEQFGGISYQTLLIISQVFGYMFSKFAGIRFISELKKQHRFVAAMSLVGVSWASLLFFAIVPAPWGMLFLFVNGFALGFLWGIIFSYIEGRRSTDFVGALMAVSFIFAGGFTRSVAKWLMVDWQVSEKWMPFVTGMLFIAPLIILFILLEKIPPPDEEDILERTKRRPMDKRDRSKVLRSLGAGLIVIVFCYLLLTVMRDLRDNYMANIWQELGYGSDYAVFTRTETVTSVIVLAVMGLLVVVRKNIRALSIVHYIIGAGFVIAALSSLLFLQKQISGGMWMQAVSIGLYMGYIPFNCIFFERLIAAFRIQGTIGFLMYFADAFGYLGSVAVMMIKELSSAELSWSVFYSGGVIFVSVVGIAGTFFSLIYFNRKYSCRNVQPS